MRRMDDGSPAPADFEGLDFVPVMVGDMDDGDAGGKRVYRIVFRPKPELLKKANEPLYIVRELQKLGELALTAETDGLPPLTELEPDRPYIGWTGTLTTESTRDQVEEVFEFVTDDCDIEIVEENPAPDAVPAAEAERADGPKRLRRPPFPSAAAPSIVPPEPGAVVKPAPVPASAEAATAPRAAPAKAVATTTRVELDKIDRVVNLVGELVIAQAMLGQVVQGMPEEATGRLVQVLEEVSHHTRELKDSVMSMRAQPIGAVFQRMPRLVRELAAKTGKKVRLEMHGEGTEVDRSIIERLGDPLTHIIRNSADHGIEAPDVRRAAGKNEEGTIRLMAEHRGGRIVVEVSRRWRRHRSGSRSRRRRANGASSAPMPC